MTNQLITNLTDMGKYIQDVRKFKKMTQINTSESAKIAKGTLLHFEAGRRLPQGDNLFSILVTLGIEMVLTVKEPEI